MKIHRRELRARHAIWLPWLRIMGIFVVDKNLRNSKLGYCCHTPRLLLLDRTSESPRPVKSVKETDDDIPSHSFLDTLKTRSTAKVLFQSTDLSASINTKNE
jgi:hypothetical protein